MNTDLDQWNDCIRRANERITDLQNAGRIVSARACIHGVEIEIRAFEGDSPAWEIVTLKRA